MVEKQGKSLHRVWFALSIPPILLAVLTTLVATYLAVKTQGDAQAISEGIEHSLVYILMVNHTILFLILLRIIRSDGMKFSGIGWQLPLGRKSLWSEPLIGIIAGLVLGLIDQVALSPLWELAQRIVGDYRLASEIRSSSSGGSLVAWLIALTFFAGIVEESLYRGYAVTRLRQPIGIGRAVLVSSLFFGPLHWAVGLWHMIGAMVIGALLAGVFLWRRTLVTAAVAHAVTNLVAFLWQ